MQNNAHQIESYAKRLARFQKGSPIESIETLLNSIGNYFNNEIRVTPERYQTSLLFLGIHAVALTISEIFWDLKGKDGYDKFVKTFIDGETNDTKFSTISDKIHKWRNALAHQWLAPLGHEIQYDYTMKLGFTIDDELLIINPKIYCEQYIKAFSLEGKIWNYTDFLSAEDLNRAKERIIKKFIKK